MIKKALLFLAVIISIPLALLFLRPDKTIAKAKMTEMYANEGSRFIKWRNAQLHYVDEGSGDPLILIHGYGGSHRNFKALADRLKNHYRVIRIDLPGFGLSDMPSQLKNESLIELYRSYLSFMLDTLSQNPVYLGGNSMGGWMAWEAAALRPEKVKKLILMSSAGYEMEKVKEAAAAIMNSSFVELLFLKGMPEYFTQQGAEKCFYNSEKIDFNEVKINNDMWNREGNLSAALLLATANEKPDTLRIQQVACPTLIIFGENDEIVPSQHAYRFHRDIAGSKMLLYKECGHIPMVEKPEQTANDILHFLKEDATDPISSSL